MSKKNILVTTSTFGKVDPSVLDPAAEYNIVLNPFKRKLSKLETIQLLKEFNPVGIVAGTEIYDDEVLCAGSNLKCISRVGVGTDSLDKKSLEQRGIELHVTKDHVSIAVAELVLSFTFALSRQIFQSCEDLKRGIWNKRMGQQVEGKNFGIIGYGKIGRLVGEKVRALGLNVLFYDPYIKGSETAENATQVEYSDLLKLSDFLSFNCSSNNGKPIWKLDEAKLMKDSAFVINCARGDLICENSLATALKDGLISGAALDVFLNEPYEGPLLNLPNLIGTPHQGSYARESRILMEKEAMESLINQLNQ
jgi:D-3-phosphoglycerate dehydrogenase